ncbi:MAG: PPOX class F420-dependent oxidoreductase [Myxococcota bacterium]
MSEQASEVTRRLGDERYISLATYRRDGREVRTPVWVARDRDRLYVFSEGTAGKVKRIRANGRVSAAGCDVRGGLAKDADWAHGRGRIVGADELSVWSRAYAALRTKYGWQMKLTDLLSQLTGRYKGRAMLELDFENGPPAGD